MKITNLFSMIALAIFAISFTSCSDDDDNTTPDFATELIGSYVSFGGAMDTVIVTKTSNNSVLLSNTATGDALTSNITVTINSKFDSAMVGDINADWIENTGSVVDFYRTSQGDPIDLYIYDGDATANNSTQLFSGEKQ